MLVPKKYNIPIEPLSWLIKKKKKKIEIRLFFLFTWNGAHIQITVTYGHLDG